MYIALMSKNKLMQVFFFLYMKMWPIHHERGNLVAFYYLSASEIYISGLTKLGQVVTFSPWFQ